jgi:MinD-like ATPase involved in chromosome partitioning or flagellar assembly
VDIVPLIAAKGSVGVTTAALTLAAVWPEGRGAPVVVECDPGGGDVAARFGLEVIPGVVSLAAELERSGPADPAGPGEQVGGHTQELPGGLRVLVAPTSPEEMRLPLERLAEDLPRLALGEVDLIVDCGRLEAAAMRQRTAVLRLIQRCGLMVVVVRPELAALQHLNVWLPTLRSLDVAILALLSGRGPYSAEEIAETMDLRVIGALPHDRAAADVVGGASGSRPDRSALFRAARPAGAAIAAVLGRSQSAPVAPTPLEEAVP